MLARRNDGPHRMRRQTAIALVTIALAAAPLAASVALPAASAGAGPVEVLGPITTDDTVAPESGSTVVDNGALAVEDGEQQAEFPTGVSNVTVRSDGTERGRWLEFDSALLGLRAVNHVTLPPNYGADAPPYGTLYRLHGTRGEAGSLVEPPPAPPASSTSGAAASGGVTGQATSNADTASGSTEQFLVVALDEGAGWCDRCWWVDGRNGQGVLAESHLLHEVIPVVEATFNVRTDRGGRAVYGTSMGGIGALIQAFRHPDVFAYVASQSGSPSQGEHRDESQVHQDNLYYVSYLRFQGYPDPVTEPIAYRNIDVVTLAPQVIGTDLEIVLWANDGCMPPYDPQPQPVGDPDCIRTSRLEPMDGFHMVNERGIRNQNEVLAARLADVGVPFRLETGHGRHGVSSMYPDHVIPDLNRLFSTSPVDPAVFSYKTTDRLFSIWGYDVEVLERPNEEFLHLLGAQRDGRELTLAGTGQARLRTPELARPGTAVQITVVRENAGSMSFTVTAGADCRVALELDLGPVRELDQRQDLSRAGSFDFPRTRVELAPDAPLPTALASRSACR